MHRSTSVHIYAYFLFFVLFFFPRFPFCWCPMHALHMLITFWRIVSLSRKMSETLPSSSSAPTTPGIPLEPPDPRSFTDSFQKWMTHISQLRQLEEDAWKDAEHRFLYATPYVEGFPWRTVRTTYVRSSHGVTSSTFVAPSSCASVVSSDGSSRIFLAARRHVVPYDFTINVFAKGRWVGRRLLSVYSEEFPHHSKAYYHTCILQGRLRCLSRAVLRGEFFPLSPSTSSSPAATSFSVAVKEETGGGSCVQARDTLTTTPSLPSRAEREPRKAEKKINNVQRRVTKRWREMGPMHPFSPSLPKNISPHEQDGCLPEEKEQPLCREGNTLSLSITSTTSTDRSATPMSSSVAAVSCIADSPLLQHGDLILHTIHRHEIPVTLGTSGVDPVEVIAVRIQRYGLIAIHKPSGLPSHATGRYYYNSAVAMLSYTLAPRRLHAWLIEEDPLLQSLVSTRGLCAREKKELYAYYSASTFYAGMEPTKEVSATGRGTQNAMGSTAETPVRRKAKKEQTAPTTDWPPPVETEVSLEKMPRPCHRLDRATSGVLLLGVSEEATSRVSTALMSKTHAFTAYMEGQQRRSDLLETPASPRGSSFAAKKEGEGGEDPGWVVHTAMESAYLTPLWHGGVYKRYLARVQGDWGFTEQTIPRRTWETRDSKKEADPKEESSEREGVGCVAASSTSSSFLERSLAMIPLSVLEVQNRVTLQVAKHSLGRDSPISGSETKERDAQGGMEVVEKPDAHHREEIPPYCTVEKARCHHHCSLAPRSFSSFFSSPLLFPYSSSEGVYSCFPHGVLVNSPTPAVGFERKEDKDETWGERRRETPQQEKKAAWPPAGKHENKDRRMAATLVQRLDVPAVTWTTMSTASPQGGGSPRVVAHGREENTSPTTPNWTRWMRMLELSSTLTTTNSTNTSSASPSLAWPSRVAATRLPTSLTHVSREGSSLLLCLPLTGRFHQIRRHLQECGHPILGEEEESIEKQERRTEKRKGTESDVTWGKLPSLLTPPDGSGKGFIFSPDGAPLHGETQNIKNKKCPEENTSTFPSCSPLSSSSSVTEKEVLYFQPDWLPQGYRALHESNLSGFSRFRDLEAGRARHGCRMTPPEEGQGQENAIGEEKEEEGGEPFCYECAHWLPVAALPFPPPRFVVPCNEVQAYEVSSPSPRRTGTTQRNLLSSQTNDPLSAALHAPLSNPHAKTITLPSHMAEPSSTSCTHELCLHAWSYTIEEDLVLCPPIRKPRIPVICTTATTPTPTPPPCSTAFLPVCHETGEARESFPNSLLEGEKEKIPVRSPTTQVEEEEEAVYDTATCWRTEIPTPGLPFRNVLHANDGADRSYRASHKKTLVTFCSGRIPEWAI